MSENLQRKWEQAEINLVYSNGELGKARARIRELEAGLAEVVKNCEFCDDGFIEYQPSGIDGYLPTGDANFVTEPCPNCSAARALLKGK